MSFTANNVAKRASCERCRGQKLKCTTTASSSRVKLSAKCDRCLSVKAECIFKSPHRPGRPRKSNVDRRAAESPDAQLQILTQRDLGLCDQQQTRLLDCATGRVDHCATDDQTQRISTPNVIPTPGFVPDEWTVASRTVAASHSAGEIFIEHTPAQIDATADQYHQWLHWPTPVPLEAVSSNRQSQSHSSLRECSSTQSTADPPEVAWVPNQERANNRFRMADASSPTSHRRDSVTTDVVDLNYRSDSNEDRICLGGSRLRQSVIQRTSTSFLSSGRSRQLQKLSDLVGELTHEVETKDWQHRQSALPRQIRPLDKVAAHVISLSSKFVEVLESFTTSTEPIDSPMVPTGITSTTVVTPLSQNGKTPLNAYLSPETLSGDSYSSQNDSSNHSEPDSSYGHYHQPRQHHDTCTRPPPSPSATPSSKIEVTTILQLLICYIHILRLHCTLYTRIWAHIRTPSSAPTPIVSDIAISSLSLAPFVKHQAKFLTSIAVDLLGQIEGLLGLPPGYRISYSSQAERLSPGILDRSDSTHLVQVVLRGNETNGQDWIAEIKSVLGRLKEDLKGRVDI